MKYFLGIDLGKAGGFVFMSETGEILCKMHTPIHVDGEIDHCSIERFYAKCLGFAGDRDNVYVFMERCGARVGNGARSMYSFGKNNGYVIAITNSWFGRDIDEVTPRVWQRWLQDLTGVEEVFYDTNLAISKVKGAKRDTKATVIRSIEKLYPKEDFTKSKQARKPHDGITDAVGIALWGLHNGRYKNQ